MFNTFERELIANQRHQELLQSIARQQRYEQATATGRPIGLIAMLTAKLRGTASEARPAKTAAARA